MTLPWLTARLKPHHRPGRVMLIYVDLATIHSPAAGLGNDINENRLPVEGNPANDLRLEGATLP